VHFINSKLELSYAKSKNKSMKSTHLLIASLLLFAFFNTSFSQNEIKNKGEFIEPKNGFYNEILKESDFFISEQLQKEKYFKVDFTGLDLPKDLSEFKNYWHTPTVSQGLTGTCWSFSTTSYFESEIYRLHNKQVKLSEMYTVYWEYVEKAKYFVKTRGKSHFAEGSEANAVTRIWKDYGIVPLEAYSGLLPGQTFHDHRKLIQEMSNFLQSVKSQNAWNEEEVTNTIKSILNNYMGTPPSVFKYEGDEYSPKDFLDKVCNLKIDNYIDIMSLMQEPYYKKSIYDVEDNWWFNKDYYNVPLDIFMNLIKSSIRNGYTICIGGDVSEPGIDSWHKVAMIPTFDIPSEYIDENSREFRFYNKTTGDDHGIHLVGYTSKNGKDWYLIKDSGAGSKNVEPKGYYYFNEDFVKLKMLTIMVHKDAVGDLLSKF
jgi:bleomycin hydrolase